MWSHRVSFWTFMVVISLAFLFIEAKIPPITEYLDVYNTHQGRLAEFIKNDSILLPLDHALCSVEHQNLIVEKSDNTCKVRYTGNFLEEHPFFIAFLILASHEGKDKFLLDHGVLSELFMTKLNELMPSVLLRDLTKPSPESPATQPPTTSKHPSVSLKTTKKPSTSVTSKTPATKTPATKNPATKTVTVPPKSVQTKFTWDPKLGYSQKSPEVKDVERCVNENFSEMYKGKEEYDISPFLIWLDQFKRETSNEQVAPRKKSPKMSPDQIKRFARYFLLMHVIPSVADGLDIQLADSSSPDYKLFLALFQKYKPYVKLFYRFWPELLDHSNGDNHMTVMSNFLLAVAKKQNTLQSQLDSAFGNDFVIEGRSDNIPCPVKINNLVEQSLLEKAFLCSVKSFDGMAQNQIELSFFGTTGKFFVSSMKVGLHYASVLNVMNYYIQEFHPTVDKMDAVGFFNSLHPFVLLLSAYPKMASTGGDFRNPELLTHDESILQFFHKAFETFPFLNKHIFYFNAEFLSAASNHRFDVENLPRVMAEFSSKVTILLDSAKTKLALLHRVDLRCDEIQSSSLASMYNKDASLESLVQSTYVEKEFKKVFAETSYSLPLLDKISLKVRLENGLRDPKLKARPMTYGMQPSLYPFIVVREQLRRIYTKFINPNQSVDTISEKIEEIVKRHWSSIFAYLSLNEDQKTEDNFVKYVLDPPNGDVVDSKGKKVADSVNNGGAPDNFPIPNSDPVSENEGTASGNESEANDNQTSAPNKGTSSPLAPTYVPAPGFLSNSNPKSEHPVTPSDANAPIIIGGATQQITNQVSEMENPSTVPGTTRPNVGKPGTKKKNRNRKKKH